jgi:hypothetical protein
MYVSEDCSCAIWRITILKSILVVLVFVCWFWYLYIIPFAQYLPEMAKKLVETCRKFTTLIIVINSHSFICNLWFYSHNFYLSSTNNSYYTPFTKYLREIKPSHENYGSANTLSQFVHILQYCENEVPTLASAHLSNPSDCPNVTSSQSVNIIFYRRSRFADSKCWGYALNCHYSRCSGSLASSISVLVSILYFHAVDVHVLRRPVYYVKRN